MGVNLNPFRDKLEKINDWLQSAGFGALWLERFVQWWKQFGLPQAIALIVAISFPLLKYAVLPQVASLSASAMAEGHDIELEIEDWSADLLDLAVTAHDVTVRTAGRFAQDEILTARQVEVDLSLWRRIRTGIFSGSWVHGVTIVEPSIYLERLPSGRWNWQDLTRARPEPFEDGPIDPSTPDYHRVAEDRLREAEERGAFTLPRLQFEDLRLAWVENQPGGSGGGIHETVRATLYLDDVDILIQDLSLPVESGSPPAQVSVEGRTADGRISIDGSGNFFRWSSRPPVLPPFLQYVDVRESTQLPRWAPTFRLRIHLDNIGWATLGRMVPIASLWPASGTLSGEIDLEVRDREISCRTDLATSDVSFTPNPRSPGLRGRSDQLQRELSAYRSNRRVATNCDGHLENRNYRPLYACQAAVTRESVGDAPPAVRQTAAWDDERLGGRIVDQGVDVLSAVLTHEAAEALSRNAGPVAGQAFSQSLQPQSGEAGSNPVSQGLKSAGRGIKKIFGGGKKKKKN